MERFSIVEFSRKCYSYSVMLLSNHLVTHIYTFEILNGSNSQKTDQNKNTSMEIQLLEHL